MASQGHLTITLPEGNSVTGQGFSSDLVPTGGFTFDLYCDDISYEDQPAFRQAVLDQGEVDYQSTNPEQGVTWNILENLEQGVGGFYAGRGRFNKGTYSACDNFDAEYLCQGPLQVNEYPGIPFGVSPVGSYNAGTNEIVWTDSAAHALFMRVRGEHFWHQIGGSTHYAQGTSTLMNTWQSLSNTMVKCVAHLGTRLMVGFGSGTSWVYTADYTNPVPPTWVAQPETGDDAYAHVAVNAVFETAAGVYEECIVFLGDNGKLFKTANPAAAVAAALADGSTIGDATDDTANSITMADSNRLIFIGKDSGLYWVDAAGNVGSRYRRKFPARTTSDSGGLAPANFRHVTELDDYTYWLVGDYTIIEREPIDGTLTEFGLKGFGPNNPRMHLPITAMCAGPDGTLYLTVGTSSSTLLDLSVFAGGTQLMANTITAGTSYLVKGFGRAHLLKDNPAAWTWHMSMGSIAQIACSMWYAEDIQRLSVGLYTDTTDRASSYLRVTQDNFATFRNEDDSVRGTGTGEVTLMDTLANGDAILVGFPRRFTSIAFDMTTPFNNNASALTVAYSTGAGTWTTVTDMLEGTRNATAAFARDGVIQWDMPTTATAWALATYNSVSAYWVRITTSALLDNITWSSALIGYGENLRQFVVVSGNPVMKKDTGPYDTSGTVKVTSQTAVFESGKFHNQMPLDIKAGLTFNAIVQNITTGSLTAKYRTASDRTTGAGYASFSAYTTDALALAGSTFSYSSSNPVNWTEGMRVQLAIAPNSDGTPIRLEAALVRFLMQDPGYRRINVRLSEAVNGPMRRDGARATSSLRELVTNLQAWRRGVNPVATVVDHDLGLSMRMKLADFDPRAMGVEKNRGITLTMVEVAG